MARSAIFEVSWMLLFAVLSSCGPNSTSSNGPLAVKPGQGSYYIFREETIENATGLVLHSDTSIETFQQTGQTLLGKTNVSVIATTTPGSTSPYLAYINYEPNGDIDFYNPGDGSPLSLGPTGWFRCGFASQQPDTVSFDSLADGGVIHKGWSITGEGGGFITILGRSFSTQKVISSIIQSFAGDTGAISILKSEYAPLLGYVVKTEQPLSRYGNEHYVSEVVDYHLQ